MSGASTRPLPLRRKSRKMQDPKEEKMMELQELGEVIGAGSKRRKHSDQKEVLGEQVG